MEQHAAAGQVALALEKPQQAVKQFSDGLARARERDDAAAIGDLAFNLAVAELRAEQPDAALETARDAEAELARRRITPGAELRLAEAIALYRAGQAEAADRVSAQVESAADGETGARAAFLRGLIADETGNIAGLRSALGRIAAATGAEHQADAAELTARLSLREGDARRARAEAERAADLRREVVDYRAMARCLALAGRAAAMLGDGAAADLYLRAGRTAAARGDKASAQRWLTEAVALSRDPVMTQTARSLLPSVAARWPQ